MIGQYIPLPIPPGRAPAPAPAPGPQPSPGPELNPNWIGCPGVDTEHFKQRCRIPLFGTPTRPDWNIWVIERTNRDGASASEAVDNWFLTGPLQGQLPGLWYVINYWFGANASGPANLSRLLGARGIDNVIVTDNINAPVVIEGKRYTLLEMMDQKVATSRDRDRTQCSPYLITTTEVQPGTTQRFFVAFMYRGSKADMPWPVYRFDDYLALGAYETWCPVGADYAVTEVYAPSASIVRPKEPVIDVQKMIEGIVPAGLNPAKSLTGVAFWAGVGVVTAMFIANRVEGAMP